MIDKELFSYWVMEPRQVAKKDIADLTALAEQYPFCQLVHTLAAKAVSMTQPEAAASFIPRAALYALNRQALRSLLEDDLEWSETLLSRMTGGAPPARSISRAEELLHRKPAQTAPQAGRKEETKADSEPVPYDPAAVAEFAIARELLGELPDRHEAPVPPHSTRELIARFIRTDPTIGALKPETGEPASAHEDLSQRNQLSIEDFATESFADILVRQGKIERAIGIYERLMLKIPEKSDYFAEKIKNLK